jgi:hypothetical protein
MAFILEKAEMKIGRRRSVTYLGEIFYLLWSLLTSTGTGAQLYADAHSDRLRFAENLGELPLSLSYSREM